MSGKTKGSDKNGSVKSKELSVWSRVVTANSEWPDKVSVRLGFFVVFPLYSSNLWYWNLVNCRTSSWT